MDRHASRNRRSARAEFHTIPPVSCTARSGTFANNASRGTSASSACSRADRGTSANNACSRTNRGTNRRRSSHVIPDEPRTSTQPASRRRRESLHAPAQEHARIDGPGSPGRLHAASHSAWRRWPSGVRAASWELHPMIKHAYALGRQAAFRKFALGPPTQVDQFVTDIEQGKDVLPEPPPAMQPTALDGTVPMPPLPSFGAGSTVAPELAGAPADPAPSVRPAEG